MRRPRVCRVCRDIRSILQLYVYYITALSVFIDECHRSPSLMPESQAMPVYPRYSHLPWTERARCDVASGASSPSGFPADFTAAAATSCVQSGNGWIFSCNQRSAAFTASAAVHPAGRRPSWLRGNNHLHDRVSSCVSLCNWGLRDELANFFCFVVFFVARSLSLEVFW